MSVLPSPEPPALLFCDGQFKESVEEMVGYKLDMSEVMQLNPPKEEVDAMREALVMERVLAKAKKEKKRKDKTASAEVWPWDPPQFFVCSLPLPLDAVSQWRRERKGWKHGAKEWRAAREGKVLRMAPIKGQAARCSVQKQRDSGLG